MRKSVIVSSDWLNWKQYAPVILEMTLYVKKTETEKPVKITNLNTVVYYNSMKVQNVAFKIGQIINYWSVM